MTFSSINKYTKRLQAVVDLYKDNFTRDALAKQLDTLQTAMPARKDFKTIADIVAFFRQLHATFRLLFSEVIHVLGHVLVTLLSKPPVNDPSPPCDASRPIFTHT